MTDDNTKASEQFDLEMGMEFDATITEIHELADALEQAESVEVTEWSTEELAEWIDALKRLEDATEESRKEIFEAELDSRVEAGETVGNVSKVNGTNTYVTDHEAAFDAVLEHGHDPRDVAKVSASKLQDVLEQDAEDFIGTSTYSYFRRQS